MGHVCSNCTPKKSIKFCTKPSKTVVNPQTNQQCSLTAISNNPCSLQFINDNVLPLKPYNYSDPPISFADISEYPNLDEKTTAVISKSSLYSHFPNDYETRTFKVLPKWLKTLDDKILNSSFIFDPQSEEDSQLPFGLPYQLKDSKHIYVGQWKNGLQHGRGVLYMVHLGEVFEGDWHHGLRHGKGRLFRKSSLMIDLVYEYGEIKNETGRSIISQMAWFQA